MHRRLARTAALTVLAVLASVFTLVSPAQAAESIPTLQWPSVNIGTNASSAITGPDGSATFPCKSSSSSGSNLITYSATGTVVREFDRTTTVDGVTNCITQPAVGKDGDVYGSPNNTSTGNYGPNLLAYDGNTLKWKYPASCGSSYGAQVVAGADGNIYAMTDGHLIGLTPEVAAGQTQPTKVLDVTIPSDCSIQLRAYKDGLVLHGQNSGGNALYYSYAGKFLGRATIGDVWYEKINLDGKLFVSSQVTTGTYQSGKVTMYDPRTGQVEWSTVASTLGAGVTGIQVYPTAGGGAVARITEQKMLTGGIPASPTVYVTTLAVIDASGNVVRRLDLGSGTYTNGSITGTYGSTYILPDTQGNVGVVRELNLNTGSNPSTVAAIEINRYNLASNTWPYQQLMRGELSTTGGPNGYSLQTNSVLYPIGITSNTMYIPAKCFGNSCANYAQNKLYPIQITGLGMDYPRGAVLATTFVAQPAPVSYVALGDSFSSGEGVAPFDSGTDIASYNKCHRSKLAYATFVSRNPMAPQTLATGAFRACSGAEVNEIWNTNPDHSNEPAQMSYITSSTAAVSITIGGNDIGFAAFGAECFWSTTTCRDGSTGYTNTTNEITNTLPAKLRSTYKGLLAQNSNNAEIYVLGYPHVAPVKDANDPAELSCSYLYDSGYDSTGTVPIRWADAQAARAIVDQLNDAILTAVEAVRAENLNNANTRLHYVNVNGLNSPFRGHEVCSDLDSYFLNVNQAAIDQNYIFHPNAKGQKAYADILTDYIASH